MKKVLCPICGNVIKFDESEHSLTCPICHSFIKIKIQKADDNTLDVNQYGLPSESLFSEDEVIIAELDNTAPQKGIDGASLKSTRAKRSVDLYSKANNLGSIDGNNWQERTPNIDDINVSEQNYKALVPTQSQWINWNDIECESELFLEGEIVKANEVRQSKKRLKVPTDKRLKYLPTYTIVSFISAILMFYSPVLQINGQNIGGTFGAQFIGEILYNDSPSFGMICFALIAIAFLFVCVFYAYYAFKHYGEYDKNVLTISCALSSILFWLSIMFVAGIIYCAVICDTHISMLWSSAFIVFALQLYVFISNIDKLPKYQTTKQVLLSPKSSQKKSYILLGISYFAIWMMVINIVISFVGNIGYAVSEKFDASAETLDKYSTLSIGMFGALYRLILTDASSVDFVFGVRASFELYSYIDYASSVAMFLLVIIYAKYASKTSSIFLEEIKPKGNDNVLLEDEIKEKNLAAFLKKSSTISFLIYALIVTLNVASYAVLYRGTGHIYLAIFTMLSFIFACAITCYPYAILAREQYMKAYVEYDEMGAEIPPMSKSQQKMLELLPTSIAIVANVIFIIFAFV